MVFHTVEGSSGRFIQRMGVADTNLLGGVAHQLARGLKPYASRLQASTAVAEMLFSDDCP